MFLFYNTKGMMIKELKTSLYIYIARVHLTKLKKHNFFLLSLFLAISKKLVKHRDNIQQIAKLDVGVLYCRFVHQIKDI